MQTFSLDDLKFACDWSWVTPQFFTKELTTFLLENLSFTLKSMLLGKKSSHEGFGNSLARMQWMSESIAPS